MRAIYLLLALAIVCVSVSAISVDESRILWLRRNGRLLKTEEFNVEDKNDNDLKVFDQYKFQNIIGLGEAGHGWHKHQTFRARLFRYFVQNHGFRAIAFESGFIEMRLTQL